MNENGFIQYVTLGGSFQFFLGLYIPFLFISFFAKKRSYFPLRALLIAAIAFPFYYLPQLSLFGITYSYLICWGAIVASGFILYKERAGVILLNATAAFAIQHLNWNLNGILIDILPNVRLYTNVAISIIFYSVTCFLLLLEGLLFYKSRMQIQLNRSWPVVYAIAITIIFVTWLLSQYITEWNVYIRLYTCLTVVLSLVCLFVFPALVHNVEATMALRNEKTVLENLIEQKSRQNEVSTELREIMRIHIHDLRHQLEAFETYDESERNAYIAKVRDDLDLYQGFAKTGDDAVDILLTEKSLLCHSKGIRFNYIVDGGALSFLQKADMVALVGNMLDNAIEAASKEDDERRIVKFHVHSSQGILAVECVNYADHLSSFSLADYSSSKAPDGSIHGYGIKSMKYIAKKYGGELDVTFENAIFTVSALIPISPK